MILQRLNKSDEALKNLELAINLNKKAELYNLKAIIHENLGEDQKALENWGKAIKIKKIM